MSPAETPKQLNLHPAAGETLGAFVFSTQEDLSVGAEVLTISSSCRNNLAIIASVIIGALERANRFAILNACSDFDNGGRRNVTR